ncbi:MAG: hypothetical protein AAB066_04875, partial [Candidatus Margulisiibacteriota bacterium]
MPRPLRVEYPGAYYHIRHRLRSNPALFKTPSPYLIFLDLIGKVSQLFELECLVFCLTPKEFHLLIRTPHGQLSKAMKQLFGGFAKKMTGLTHQKGPFFIDRYKAILIDPDWISDISSIIHWMPVTLKKATTPEAYPWSSIGAYIAPTDAGWLQTRFILNQFDKKNPYLAYKTFMAQGVPAELVKFYKRKKKASVLGSDAFVTQITEKTKTRRIEKAPTPDMDTLIQSTAEILGEPIAHILASRRGRLNPQLGRSCAMYLCRHLGRHTITDIAKKFNVSHYSTVSVRIRRFRAVLQKNPRLKAKLDLLVKTAGKFKIHSPAV